MTKLFSQGRDLSKPLVDVAPNASWWQRILARIATGYLFLAGCGAAFAGVVALVWIFTA